MYIGPDETVTPSAGGGGGGIGTEFLDGKDGRPGAVFNPLGGLAGDANAGRGGWEDVYGVPGGCAAPATWYLAPTYGYKGGGGGERIGLLVLRRGIFWISGARPRTRCGTRGTCPEDFYLVQENEFLILQESGWSILIDY